MIKNFLIFALALGLGVNFYWDHQSSNEVQDNISMDMQNDSTFRVAATRAINATNNTLSGFYSTLMEIDSVTTSKYIKVVTRDEANKRANQVPADTVNTPEPQLNN